MQPAKALDALLDLADALLVFFNWLTVRHVTSDTANDGFEWADEPTRRESTV
jgi:hypothetical protein